MGVSRLFGVVGAFAAFVAVAAGAFGAHTLRGRLDAEALAVFETAARYQMYHALGLLLIAALGDRMAGPWATGAGWLFVAGMLLFSGSLYALALSGIRALGAITPIGGLCFLAGWLLLAWGWLARSAGG